MCTVYRKIAAMLCVALGATAMVSCNSYDDADETVSETTHLGMYSFSRDLLDIYDVMVTVKSGSNVLAEYDLKNGEAYYENDDAVSYDISIVSPATVLEYSLTIKCSKDEEELDENRLYDLGFNSIFTSVTQQPERVLSMMKNYSSDRSSQKFSGNVLQSLYGAEYDGMSVYEVYAEVNSLSYVVDDNE